MIKEKTFYSIKCDGCGRKLPNILWHHTAYYETIDFIEEAAIDSDWKKLRGKHYCPDCYQYGDNNELILKDGVVIQPEEEDWR